MVYVRGCGSEDLFKQKAKTSTARLLARLIEHHDFNIPAPLPAIERRTIQIEAPALCCNCRDPIFVIDRVRDIKRAATKYFQLHSTDLDSHRRTAKLAYSRQVAMYLAKTLTLRSLPEIGRRFGGRDHSTVLHAVRKMERLVKSDWMIAFDIALLEGVIIGDNSHEQVR